MLRTPLFSEPPADHVIARVEFTETGPVTVWVPQDQRPLDETELPF